VPLNLSWKLSGIKPLLHDGLNVFVRIATRRPLKVFLKFLLDALAFAARMLARYGLSIEVLDG
jgi:hypothetical protein